MANGLVQVADYSGHTCKSPEQLFMAINLKYSSYGEKLKSVLIKNNNNSSSNVSIATFKSEGNHIIVL